jgi:hypothetical protein
MPREKVADPVVSDVAEADQVEHLADAAAVDVVAVRQPAQVVGGAAPTLDGLGVQQRPHHSQGVGQLAVGRAVDGDGAAGRCVESQDHAHGCRLAGAVGSQKAGNPAGLDGEGNVVDRHRPGIALGEMGCLDHFFLR